MKRTNFMTLILLGTLLSSIAFGQDYLSNETLIASDRSLLESSLKFSSARQDSFEFKYEKSPGRAFLLSGLIPGLGQIYSSTSGIKWDSKKPILDPLWLTPFARAEDFKWKPYVTGIAFMTVEAASWIVYFNRKNKGEDLEKAYKKYADENWTLSQLYQNSLINQKTGLSGSHNIYLEYDNTEYEGNTVYLDTALVGWESYILSGDIQPIRTRDYYENIGKYDQFSGGWNDFLNFNSDPDTVYMSDLRDSYLNQRKDSNDALKMATNFATVIMFNHLISAFHAQIAAKNYSSEAERVSWHVGIVTDVRQKNPFRGLSLSVAF